MHADRNGDPGLTADQIVRAIQDNPNYTPGTPVRIAGCHLANNPDLAQDIANRLNAPVTVATDAVGVPNKPDSPAHIRNGGQWVTHHPASPTGETPSPTRHEPSNRPPSDPTQAVDYMAYDPPPHVPDTPERSQDLRDLRDRNRALRSEGFESVRARTGRNPMADVSRPLERALSTARYRSDSADDPADFYNFSGASHDWKPASEAPERPPKGQRTFDTTHANAYDPTTDDVRDGEGSARTHDSEPKLLEELVRHQLAEQSGLEPEEVDRILREASRSVDDEARKQYADVRAARQEIDRFLRDENTRLAAEAKLAGSKFSPRTIRDLDPDDVSELTGIPRRIVNEAIQDSQIVHKSVVPDMAPGSGAREDRARERVRRAIDEINPRGVEQRGNSYRPFSTEDISGDLRMVIDLPSARDNNIPARFQVCDSCTGVLDVYQKIFPNVRVDAVNLRMERIYPL
ncbi:hypothetical protein IU421_17525 [Nocardia cyriacigeorgica]|nr:hypothetical protein [Nocardia cyriacigeorgica]MBF6343377.1 hypothetical protein [Nocardia cyriacigeorgica]MBF6516058.1 hypothetical protein [Nocardia cyriacigeorgica]